MVFSSNLPSLYEKSASFCILFTLCTHYARIYARVLPALAQKSVHLQGARGYPLPLRPQNEFLPKPLPKPLPKRRKSKEKTRKKEQIKNTAKQHRKKRVCTCFPLQKTRCFAQKTRIFCTPCVKKEGFWLLLRQLKNTLAKVNFGARSWVAFSFFSLCILSILPFCFLNDVTNTCTICAQKSAVCEKPLPFSFLI